MVNIRRSSILGTVGAATLLLAATSASADPGPAFDMFISSGEHGPVNPNGKQNAGPGTEQPAVTAIEMGEDVYLVMMWMQTYDQPNNHNVYWQGACASVKLSKDAPPELVTPPTKISNVDSTRPWNRPSLATAGQYAILAWGDNNANGNTRTYVRGYDINCNPVTDKVRVSNNNNNNDGGPNISPIGTIDGKPWMFVDYESDGGSDSQTMALAVSFDETNMSLTREWIKAVVNPCDIARQTHAVHNTDYTLHCAPQGDQRPAEDGVVCAYIDNHNGNIMWKENIAPSNANKDMYYTQPDVVYMGGNNFMVQLSMSNGAGQGTNHKGTTENFAIILKNVGPDGMQQSNLIPTSPGNYAFHTKACSGQWGPDSEYFAGFMDSSPTGLGQASISFVGLDPVTNQIKLDPNRKWVINAENSDGGYLQNIYGGNPHTQGRGFQRCISGVKNPAYGVAGGFKADSSTLWVWPHTARPEGNDKLSLYLGILDGISNAAKEPAPPTDDPGEVAVQDPTTPQDTPPPANDPSNPRGYPTLGGPQSSGGCTVTNLDNGEDDMTGLFALGLGAALWVSRRRREV